MLAPGCAVKVTVGRKLTVVAELEVALAAVQPAAFV